MFRFISLPYYFKGGEEWTSNWNSVLRYHKLTKLNSPVTINGNVFNDCIRIDIDNTLDTDVFVKGTGYMIYAKGAGIVQIEFTRSSDNTKAAYSYLSQGNFAKRTISGFINVAGIPYANKCVQLGLRNWGSRVMTGADGSFAVQAYGPEVYLYIGEDINADNVLETVSPYAVRTYHLRNVSSDINGLIINY